MRSQRVFFYQKAKDRSDFLSLTSQKEVFFRAQRNVPSSHESQAFALVIFFQTEIMENYLRKVPRKFSELNMSSPTTLN